MTSSKLGIGTILFLGLMGFLNWLLLPPLITDFASRNDTYAVAGDEKIIEAKCRSKLAIISFCDVKLTNSITGLRSEFNYLIGGAVDGEIVSPVRFASGSQALSTTTGINHLNNRLGMFAAFLLFLVLMLFGMAKAYKKT